MKSKYFIAAIFFICININTIFAQHCGTCNSNIIALHPTYNNKLIDGLLIRLINTSNPWSTKLDKHINGFYKVYDEQTKYFYKCTKANNDPKNRRYYYDFAKNDFILIISSQTNKNGLFVIIEDVDGEKNEGEFETVIIPLDSFHTTNLCTNNIKTIQERNDYKPICLELIRKNTSIQEMQLPEFISNDENFIFSELINPYHNYNGIIQYISQEPLKQSRDVKYEYFFMYDSPVDKLYSGLKLLESDSVPENTVVVKDLNTFNNFHYFILDSTQYNKYTYVGNNKNVFNPKKNNSNTINTVVVKDSIKIIPSVLEAQIDGETPVLQAYLSLNRDVKTYPGNENLYLKHNLIVNAKQTVEYVKKYDIKDSFKVDFDLNFDGFMDYYIVNPNNYLLPHSSIIGNVTIKYFTFNKEKNVFEPDSFLNSFTGIEINGQSKTLKTFTYIIKKVNQDIRNMDIMQFTELVEDYILGNNNWKQIAKVEIISISNLDRKIYQSYKLLNDTLWHYNKASKTYRQYADFNFDDLQDYREAKENDVYNFSCEKFTYYIQNKNGNYTKDTFMSNNSCVFDMINKKATCIQKIYSWSDNRSQIVITNNFEFIKRKWKLIGYTQDIQACPNCEKINTYVYKIIDGKAVLVDTILGAE